MPDTGCLNCDAPLTSAFCSECGQKVGPARVTLRELLAQLLGETFELDGRVPRTLVPFLTRPGLLTLEYTAGRRQRYTAPLRLFLGLGVLWVLTSFSFTQWRAMHPESAPVNSNVAISVDDPDDPGRLVRVLGLEGTAVGAVAQERLDGFTALPEAEKWKRIRRAATEILPTVALALMPIFTLFLKLVLLGSGRTIPEHAIFALHVHAFGLLVLMVLRWLGTDALLAVGAAWMAGYVFLALRRAYALSWWGTIWRWAILSMFFVTITSTVFVLTLLGTAISA